jgi:transposase-like protein
MERKDSALVHTRKGLEEMEGGHRATGIPSSVRTVGPGDLSVVPDPEVSQKAIRRSFTADYKRRILREAEDCRVLGQMGALLRREGLYSSNLTTWRRQMEQGTLEALSTKKRGPKERRSDPSTRRIVELKKENQKLQHKLRQAQLIIEAQKKITEILQRSPFDQKDEKN